MPTGNAPMPRRPARNPSLVGVGVYSQSGLFTTVARDLAIPSRALPIAIVRTYYSAAPELPHSFGRGWAFAYGQTLAAAGNDVLYRDAIGAEYRFVRAGATYRSPRGLYAVLHRSKTQFVLRMPFGLAYHFETPSNGGRLTAIVDANGNAVRFAHAASQTVLTDTIGNAITIAYAGNRIGSVVDHTGRTWTYQYDANGCLQQVTQPPTAAFPGGTSFKYGYDASLRLASIVNPNGTTILRNQYDAAGRVVQQMQGAGTYQFAYSPSGSTVRTRVTLKNGARLDVEHDGHGHARKQTLWMSAAALAPEDRIGTKAGQVPVTTHARHNADGEQIEFISPDGVRTFSKYAEKDRDARAHGNLLRTDVLPAKKPASDQKRLTTRFAYEPRFQRCVSRVDPRGLKTRFDHDEHGNLVATHYPAVRVLELGHKKKKRVRVKHLVERRIYGAQGQLTQIIDPRGAVTENLYYPASDPWGLHAATVPSSTGTGYLGMVVVDAPSPLRRLKTPPASVTTGLGYDKLGNVAWRSDGVGNRTTLTYDALNRLTSTTTRAPFSYVTTLRYDASGNLVQLDTDFDRYVADHVTGATTLQSQHRRETTTYDPLGNWISRTTDTGTSIATVTVQRDANANIVRQTLPTGEVTDFTYDERDLRITKTLAVGTSAASTSSYAYTRTGRWRTLTDANGNARRVTYDGFHRYTGFEDPAGAFKTQHFDPNGNVLSATHLGDDGSGAKGGAATLKSTRYEWDALDRCVRTDKSWHDPATRKPLGRSAWDHRRGVCSRLVEYADNDLPARIWDEPGNLQEFEYDGANRLIESSDASGQVVTRQYDANGNLVRQDILGPSGPNRYLRITSQKFDAMDRVVARWVNNEPPSTFTWNALGNKLTSTNPAGSTTYFLHDDFGRRAGNVLSTMVPSGTGGPPVEQRAVTRLTWDASDRVTQLENAAGHVTHVDYDERGRRRRITFADGSARVFQRDSNGNVTRITQPNGTDIVQKFDSQNRVVQRTATMSDGSTAIERYAYDGVGRFVRATSGSTTVTRRYDSLSRVLVEGGALGDVKIQHDGGGNRTSLAYPGGARVHKSYDPVGRVVHVRDEKGASIAKYEYIGRYRRRGMTLGPKVQATFAYAQGRNRITAIDYRRASGGAAFLGAQYEHDALGKQSFERRSDGDGKGGDRFGYDTSGRLRSVQYDVSDLSNPASTFSRALSVERNALGRWTRLVVTDASGNVTDTKNASTDLRERYTSLGPVQWSNDANGNRLVEKRQDGTSRQYAYDFADRLVRITDLDASGKATMTITYVYDALGRQIRRTKKSGSASQDVRRVWVGRQLLEEWEGTGTSPARTFAYGAQSSEVLRMTTGSRRSPSHAYLSYNGRRSASALLDPSGKIVEQYEYDALGRPSPSGGIVIIAKKRGAKNASPTTPSGTGLSPAGNPFFAGGQLYDDDAGLQFVGPVAFDPATDGPVNAPGGSSGPTSSGSPPPAQSDPPPEGGGDGSGDSIDSDPSGSAVVEVLSALFKALLTGEFDPGEVITSFLAGENLETMGEMASGFGDMEASILDGVGDAAGAVEDALMDVLSAIAPSPPADMAPEQEDPNADSSEPNQSVDPSTQQSVDPNGPMSTCDGPDPSSSSSSGSSSSGDTGTSGSSDQGPNMSTPDPNMPGTTPDNGPNMSMPPDNGPNMSMPPDDGPNMSTPPATGGQCTPSDGGVSEGPGEDGYPGGAFGGGEGDGGAGAGGGGCFVRGTLVNTERGRIPIERVQVGERVVTFDFERAERAVSSVLAVHEAERDTVLAIDFGSEVVRCTPPHRFYRDGWIEARHLRAGDVVFCRDGARRSVRAIASVNERVLVYNLTVFRDKNYSVGGIGAVVHNDKVEGSGDFGQNPDSPV